MAILEDKHTDFEKLRASLQQWLRLRPGWSGGSVLRVEQASDTNGFSNETYRWFAQRAMGEPALSLILRLPPSVAGLFPEYDILRQFDVMRSLQQAAGVRMAPCRWVEAETRWLGRRFFVVDFVEGLTAADKPTYLREGWLAQASPQQQRKLWFSSIDQLIALSRVRWRGERLARLDWPDRGRSRIAQHVDLWTRRARWARQDLPRSGGAFLQDLQAWLQAHLPASDEAGIVWGDARPGNIIYRDFAPVALLDWELAVVGDPLIDLTYFLFYAFSSSTNAGLPLQGLPGFAADEESALYYCERAGRPTRDLQFYWLFNAYRILCIWQCMAALLVRRQLLTIDEALELRERASLQPGIGAVMAADGTDFFPRRPI
jgi:aminoglycoside phosphotransferase (APT) family kinase protein